MATRVIVQNFTQFFTFFFLKKCKNWQKVTKYNSYVQNLPNCKTEGVKVRPSGQQFSHTTLYEKVVRHKTCCGHAKSCCATNVHTSTIFFLINLARLQRKKWQKYVQITSDRTQHLCETIMSHEFLLNLVAQHKMSHDTRRPYRPRYVLCRTIMLYQVIRLNFCPCGRPLCWMRHASEVFNTLQFHYFEVGWILQRTFVIP